MTWTAKGLIHKTGPSLFISLGNDPKYLVSILRFRNSFSRHLSAYSSNLYGIGLVWQNK